jgi:hypothetical protein
MEATGRKEGRGRADHDPLFEPAGHNSSWQLKNRVIGFIYIDASNSKKNFVLAGTRMSEASNKCSTAVRSTILM